LRAWSPLRINYPSLVVSGNQISAKLGVNKLKEEPPSTSHNLAVSLTVFVLFLELYTSLSGEIVLVCTSYLRISSHINFHPISHFKPTVQAPSREKGKRKL
jgi:flagellar biosynthesis protein FliP